jgi:hypothetical protein
MDPALQVLEDRLAGTMRRATYANAFQQAGFGSAEEAREAVRAVGAQEYRGLLESREMLQLQQSGIMMFLPPEARAQVMGAVAAGRGGDIGSLMSGATTEQMGFRMAMLRNLRGGAGYATALDLGTGMFGGTITRQASAQERRRAIGAILGTTGPGLRAFAGFRATTESEERQVQALVNMGMDPEAARRRLRAGDEGVEDVAAGVMRHRDVGYLITRAAAAQSPEERQRWASLLTARVSRKNVPGLGGEELGFARRAAMALSEEGAEGKRAQRAFMQLARNTIERDRNRYQEIVQNRMDRLTFEGDENEVLMRTGTAELMEQLRVATGPEVRQMALSRFFEQITSPDVDPKDRAKLMAMLGSKGRAAGELTTGGQFIAGVMQAARTGFRGTKEIRRKGATLNILRSLLGRGVTTKTLETLRGGGEGATEALKEMGVTGTAAERIIGALGTGGTFTGRELGGIVPHLAARRGQASIAGATRNLFEQTEGELGVARGFGTVGGLHTEMRKSNLLLTEVVRAQKGGNDALERIQKKIKGATSKSPGKTP